MTVQTKPVLNQEPTLAARQGLIPVRQHGQGADRVPCRRVESRIWEAWAS
jgi:hypothetical protein